MKKLVSLFVLVMLAIAVSTNVVAQKSTILMGDKNTNEVKESVKIIAERLDALKDQIKDLEKEGNKKIADLERSKKILLRNPGLNQYLIIKTDAQVKKCEQKTDSLLSVCLRTKSKLEAQLNSFTVKAAGKDQQTVISLKGRNVGEVARAYRTVKYAETMNSANNEVSRKDTILVENNFYQSTFVTVSCPETDFSKSFPMSPRTKVFLPIDGPGRYFVSFKTGNNLQCQDSEFDGIHKKGYDPVTKRSFALIAELPER